MSFRMAHNLQVYAIVSIQPPWTFHLVLANQILMRNKPFWLFFLLLTFLVTLPVSWWVLAKADFFYPALHDVIGIDKHIEKYAPRNRNNKNEFERTTKAERVILFHGIVEAIHNQGDGLEALAYSNSSNELVTLLTEAEVLHLSDVAVLLDKIKPVAFVSMILWLILLLLTYIKRMQMPSSKQLMLSALFLILLSVIILSFGPEKVFNQLHIWSFPDNHQWFFYYEDSLMSTMMKAPDLFAYLCAIWSLISILLTTLLLMILRPLLGSKHVNNDLNNY